jgi:hypothetical protein
VTATVEKLRGRGVADEDIRRLFEAELSGAASQKAPRSGGPSFARATEGKRGE